MDDAELLADLLALERRGWDALCDGTGDAFYGSIMTDDALMALADGSVLHRADVASALAQASAWRTYEIAEPRLVRLGRDSAALVYVGTGYRAGEEPAFVAVMGSVYRQVDSRWRLAFYQQTPREKGPSPTPT